MSKRKVGRPKHRPTKKIQVYVPAMYYDLIVNDIKRVAHESVMVLDSANGLPTESKYTTNAAQLLASQSTYDCYSGDGKWSVIKKDGGGIEFKYVENK